MRILLCVDGPNGDHGSTIGNPEATPSLGWDESSMTDAQVTQMGMAGMSDDEGRDWYVQHLMNEGRTA